MPARGAAEWLSVVADRGAEPCLIDARDSSILTYGEVHELACRLATGLRERGYEPGSRALVSMVNGVQLSLLYVAALYAGITVIPLGPGFGVRELRSILRRSRAHGLLHGPGTRPRVLELTREEGIDRMLSIGDGEELDALRPPSGGIEPFSDWAPEDVVAIHFTSGTTGEPRGVGHRLGDFLGNADRLARATGAGPDLRFHALLPMTYLGGYFNLLILPLALGASVVVDRPFDARMVLDFWETPIRHDVTALWLVPTIMATLMQMDRGVRGRHYCASRVEFSAAGMAPLASRLREEFDAAYGVSTLENYGLAETLLAVSGTPDRLPPPGYCGTLLEDVRLRIVDGMIELATPDMMVGYLGDSGEGFELELRDGEWLPTGDLGVLEADGQLRITGRVKELIIRGGVNVSPLAVEEALRDQPGIERLAVVGMPHPILGEEIAVVVKCAPGATLGELETGLRETAKQRLDAAQQPGRYVQIDELPLTPSGKVRSEALRELVIDRFGLAPARG